jgi:hypothetical protein
MLLAAVTLSGSKTLDLIGIVSAFLGITGSLYLSYDLLGRRGGFLVRLTMGVPFGLALAGVAYVVSSTIDPAICAHVVCATGGVPPLVVASLLFAFGLVGGLITDYTWVTMPNVKPHLTLPQRVKVVSIMSYYYLRTGLIFGAVFAVAAWLLQWSFALLQFLFAQSTSSSPSAIRPHLPGLGEAVVWLAITVPVAIVLFPTYVFLIRWVDTITDRRLGFIGIVLIAAAFVLQLVPPIVDFASH